MAKEVELNRLRTIAKKNGITLLYGTKNSKLNHAFALRDVLLFKY